MRQYACMIGDRGSSPSTTELMRRNELYQLCIGHAEPETETNVLGTTLAELHKQVLYTATES